MNDHNMVDGELGSAATKIEVDREGTPSSIESTPEQEGGNEASQEPAQPQKRKGGRKPIYATSEERKQRNRQAQAAFRERRTEYIKQLEANIKQNEELLNSLQENHRRINNDCLMLRYKNSLLERILLEKGIDVQSELEMKQSSPALSTGFMNPVPGLNATPQSQLQRTALQRQQARLSGGRAFLPKLAPGQSNADTSYATSPHAHPTPSSHASSPSQLSTRSPMAMHQSGMTSPGSSVLAQSQGQQYQNFARATQQAPSQAFLQAQAQAQASQAAQRAPQRPMHNYTNSTSGISNHSVGSHHSLNQSVANAVPPANSAPTPSSSSFYPSPFQKHFDQLEQEYDAQTSRSMLDEPEPDTDETDPSPELHGAYPSQFDPHGPSSSTAHDFYPPPLPPAGIHQQQQQLAPQTQYEQPHNLPPTSHPATGLAGDASHFHIDPNDPLLDQDPFGLSASMHYPTSYSFDQQQQQQQQQQHSAR